MLNKLFQNKMKTAIVILLVLLLTSVRAFENQLFYDPFLVYFDSDYNLLPLPEFNSWQLFFGLFFRYVLNTVLSLGIIYVIFNEIELVKFASVLYVFFFLILIIAFFCILSFYGNQNNLLLFYVRRFLIQPVFVLLFIPGFYYQNKNK